MFLVDVIFNGFSCDVTLCMNSGIGVPKLGLKSQKCFKSFFLDQIVALMNLNKNMNRNLKGIV